MLVGYYFITIRKCVCVCVCVCVCRTSNILFFKSGKGLADRVPAVNRKRSDEPDLLSFAAITEEPPEITAASHNRCIILIRRRHIDAWVEPNVGESPGTVSGSR
jgi:hypothetical protein